MTLGVRVSQDVSAQVSTRCEALGLSRSQWLEGLVMADLGLAEEPATFTARPARIRDEVPAPKPAKAPAAGGAVPLDATGAPCAHPKARVLKGLCGACGTAV